MRHVMVLLLLAAMTGCSDGGDTGGAAPTAREDSAGGPGNPLRNAYFGDLHVHTRYSFDAFVFGTRTGPDDAYRFAKGEPISHPGGFEMQLDRPLDFQAVTDHAAYLGMLPAMADPDSKVGKHPVAQAIRNARSAAERRAAFQGVGQRARLGRDQPDDLLDPDVVRSAWQAIIEAAERHNDPGHFTAFVAYEYTSSGPQRENLHRNVIFRGGNAPAQPFSRRDSINPEALWDWMDALRADGIEALAIPHNSNGSNGLMFALTDWAGNPIDQAYAEQRMRNEPLVEITQVKGTSETHPLLSPNDEWADFEIMPFRIATTLPSQPHGSYVREAWRNGLALEQAGAANPYRFGVVGASDTHVSAGSFDESNYWSKVGLLDYTPELRGSVPVGETEDGAPEYAPGYFQTWGASGLAVAWAESNTRESLYAAFRRRETYATSGTRIRVRFFGGFGMDEDLMSGDEAVAQGYAAGVPMGGELVARADGAAPAFFVWAARDPQAAPLQRVQVIKGWATDEGSHEQVYDVACSDGGVVDPRTWRCPDNGARVDLTDCSISADVGAGELRTLWRDPQFDPAQRAFYYVRVLENPTCRWSTWDALARGVAPREGINAIIQERAWSSPVWYVPRQ